MEMVGRADRYGSCGVWRERGQAGEKGGVDCRWDEPLRKQWNTDLGIFGPQIWLRAMSRCHSHNLISRQSRKVSSSSVSRLVD